MKLVSWRNLATTAIAGLSLLSGTSTNLYACCLGWFGGGWGAAYVDPYPAGYYSASYYAGYAPSYYGPTYDGCGCGSSCGACSPCGPGGCGIACNNCSGVGCSNCSGGNCGITTPSPAPGTSPRPTPDDGFRRAPESSPPVENPDPATDPSAPTGRRRRPTTPTFDPTDPMSTPPADPGRAAPPAGAGSGSGAGDGFVPRNRARPVEPESSPTTSDENTFGPRDRFGTETNRPPIPKTEEKPKSNPIPDDSFGDDAEGTKTNRPVLGEPADAESVLPGKDGQTVIPGRRAAPTDVEPEEEPLADPVLPRGANRDEQLTAEAVVPKTRLAMSGRFSTPTVVRLKLRPSSNWRAEPQPAILARHR